MSPRDIKLALNSDGTYMCMEPQCGARLPNYDAAIDHRLNTHLAPQAPETSKRHRAHGSNLHGHDGDDLYEGDGSDDNDRQRDGAGRRLGAAPPPAGPPVVATAAPPAMAAPPSLSPLPPGVAEFVGRAGDAARALPYMAAAAAAAAAPPMAGISPWPGYLPPMPPDAAAAWSAAIQAGLSGMPAGTFAAWPHSYTAYAPADTRGGTGGAAGSGGSGSAGGGSGSGSGQPGQPAPGAAVAPYAAPSAPPPPNEPAPSAAPGPPGAPSHLSSLFEAAASAASAPAAGAAASAPMPPAASVPVAAMAEPPDRPPSYIGHLAPAAGPLAPMGAAGRRPYEDSPYGPRFAADYARRPSRGSDDERMELARHLSSLTSSEHRLRHYQIYMMSMQREIDSIHVWRWPAYGAVMAWHASAQSP